MHYMSIPMFFSLFECQKKILGLIVIFPRGIKRVLFFIGGRKNDFHLGLGDYYCIILEDIVKFVPFYIIFYTIKPFLQFAEMFIYFYLFIKVYHQLFESFTSIFLSYLFFIIIKIIR